MTKSHPGSQDGEDYTDLQLVALAQKELPHVTQAFEKLVERHYEGIRRLAAGFLGSPNEADALAQDVVLRIFGGLKNFRGDSEFTTWLYRIVRNLANSRMHQQFREMEKKRALEAQQISGLEDEPEPGAAFETMIAHLTVEERSIMALRFVHDLEFNQIAEILDEGLSAVKMRYYRGLDKLKKRLDPRN